MLVEVVDMVPTKIWCEFQLATLVEHRWILRWFSYSQVRYGFVCLHVSACSSSMYIYVYVLSDYVTNIHLWGGWTKASTRLILLHQPAFTPDTFYTNQLLHETPFTPTSFYNRHLLHQKPFHETSFTPDTLYTRHLLHEATFYTTHPFTPDTFYTRGLLHQTPFTFTYFYTTPFTPNTFYTKHLLHYPRQADQGGFEPLTATHRTKIA